ncbi:MAG: hypothetical protein JWP82_3325 [Humibacillus sp.]|nr:hypothetical protein [Humibacillus sp.]
MRSTTTRIAGASIAAAAAMALTVGPAFASNGWVSANLKPNAGSGVQGSGTAQVDVKGNKLTVTMAANGLLADSPHAAHIHYGSTARHECPTLKDDTNGDGHLNTTEGGPAYGDIVVSLTKTGDTSPKSGLAIDRFSTAPGGKIAYQRGSINVSSAVAKEVLSGEAVVVIHGVDYNKDGKYSGDTKSDLAPTLPTEATDPALCGVLAAAPTGGMHTGGGMSSTTNDNGMLIAVGGVALLAAAGSGAVAARRSRSKA